MLPNIDFTTTQSYKYLTDHYIDIVSKSLKELFESDNQRFEKFSCSLRIFCWIIRKTALTSKRLHYCIQLARECGVNKAIEAMYSGEVINVTEGRPVLHIALRNRSNTPIYWLMVKM
jgi:glucose-6-phosphate isomerase